MYIPINHKPTIQVKRLKLTAGFSPSTARDQLFALGAPAIALLSHSVFPQCAARANDYVTFRSPARVHYNWLKGLPARFYLHGFGFSGWHKIVKLVCRPMDIWCLYGGLWFRGDLMTSALGGSARCCRRERWGWQFLGGDTCKDLIEKKKDKLLNFAKFCEPSYETSCLIIGR